LEKTMKIMKVLFLLAVTSVFLSCAKEAPVAKEETPTTLRGEEAAKNLASLIPEGWQVSSQLQAEPLVVGYDYSGDGKLDFIALLERVPGGEAGPGSSYAMFYAQSTADGKLQQVFLNHGAFQENQTGSFSDAALEGFNATPQNVELVFKGGNDWQWKAHYNFSYEDEHFYLSDAETVVWHKLDPNAIDQKEYDFKSYFLRSTVVSDCGTITCNELQLTGDNEKMRVKLADFHYTDSLVTFADLL
jgi:hypothetical protein